MAIQWGKRAWDSINCRLLQVISSLPLLELRVFTFYLKFTNITTQVDLSSLPIAAPPNSFLSCRQNCGKFLSSDLYRRTLNTVDTRLKFYAISISWAKTNLLSQWTYISSLQTSFDSNTVKEPSSKLLLRLPGLVLTLDCFSIADSCYKGINGVAMGTIMGPS